MPILYGDAYSGNCYKVQLLLHLLDVAYTWRPLNILNQETRSAEFLSMNLNGRIPLLKRDDGRTLAESNAILYYLADGSTYMPAGRFACAEILQWQNFEQYSHEPNIATSRYIRRYLGNPATRQADLAAREAPGYAALTVMEQHLQAREFFAAERYTIADISLYAYTHVAHEGGFSLDNYANIRAWLARVASQPRHIAMASNEELEP
jgi:glutathione S-transferase